MATPTTKKSLERLRKDGYTCAIVEVWNAHAFKRQDLFGFIDILAIKEGEIIGVQTTSLKCFADHVKKITQHKNFMAVKKSGIKIVLHGWHQVEHPKGRRLLWACREQWF